MADDARRRFFYGYIVVFGAWLAMFVSAGAQYSFAIFQPVLLEEFGWTRGMISLGPTLNTITMLIFGLVGGYLVDRIGPKWTIIIGAIIGGIGVALLSTITQVWHFILIYGVLVPIGTALSYWIATVSTVRRWFMRRAALMVSIVLMGSGLGIVFLVPAANAIIEAWGFRTGYIAFGAILLVGAIIGGLLLKKDPESAGTYPDGVKPSEDELKTREDFRTRTEHWSVREALKTPSWWLLIGSHLGHSLALMGLLAHLITWGALDLGIPLDTMVIIYSYVFVLSAVFGRLLGGFISDWYMSRFNISRKPILYFNILGVGLGVFLCPMVGSTLGMVLVALLLGFSYGSGLAIFPTYTADLFGVMNIPLLLAIMAIFIDGFAALAPVFYGLTYDITGSFNTAFIITGVLCVLSAVCLVFLKSPRKKTKNAK
jgi:MFS family permease